MSAENHLHVAVEKVLADLNILLARDGGTLELAEITPDGIVRIHLKGLCVDCTESMAPVGRGVERIIKGQVPEIKEVIVFNP